VLNDPTLRQHRAFLLWREEPNPVPGKKPLKVPLHHDGKTRHSTGNPATPLTADEAEAWAAYTGCNIGFRPSPETRLACLDLDNSVGTPAAQQWLTLFAGAGVELSHSGRGYHIWFTYSGEGPGRRGKVKTDAGELELYSDGQFIALGKHVSGSAATDCTVQMNVALATYFPARGSVGAVKAADFESKTDQQRAECLADLESALAHLDLSTYATWVTAGQNLACLGDLGLDLWDKASQAATGYPGREELEFKWGTFSGDRSDYRSIFAKAQKMGWQQPRRTPDPASVFTNAPFDPSVPAVAPTEALTFSAAAGGAIPASPANVVGALRSDESGIKLGTDQFKGVVCIGEKGKWRPLGDNDYMNLRVALEARGFKPVGPEVMNSAVALVASQNPFDSAIEWAETLKWDGVPRIDTSLTRYFGAEDNAYTRAVGAYLWTALAGRVLVPGCQADMAVIFVGLQGAGKTSAISAIAPTEGAFCEVDLTHKDETLARLMRGKLVGEIAEMKGIAGRQSDATKAFVTRRIERWIPKYREFETSFARRLVLIGSANDDGLLDDPTGERRWLPLNVPGKINLAALRRDRDQLWAEGVVRFQQGGIAWEEAMTLAAGEHSKFKIVDELEESVREWLEGVEPHVPGTALDTTPRGQKPFALVALAAGLGIRNDRFDMPMQRRLGKVLKGLGYTKKDTWVAGKNLKMWRAN
jgi:hypothetical protein